MQICLSPGRETENLFGVALDQVFTGFAFLPVRIYCNLPFFVVKMQNLYEKFLHGNFIQDRTTLIEQSFV